MGKIPLARAVDAPSPANPVWKPGPRKVIVGTSLFSVFTSERPYVSLDHRLKEIGQRLGEIDADARKKYGRGADIAVFPELSLNPRGEEAGDLIARAVPLEGKVRNALGKMAKSRGTYLVVSFNMLEKGRTGPEVSNAAVIFDRQGKLAGIYRKAFLTPKPDGSLEGGKIPGAEFPVFDTDFGRIAVAICFDLGFDEMMQTYASKGAELVLWPSMSPQTLMPRVYARRFGFHIVSSTPRDNASVFDPAGHIAAQTTTEGPVTEQIDLSYAIVHFQPAARNGQALAERFGSRVGFRYSTTEDTGIFWSNDPSQPIGVMLQECGILSEAELRNTSREKREKILSGRKNPG